MTVDFLDEKEKKILELKSRMKIYGVVKKFAGCHFREIERKSNLLTGTVKYHLSYLTKYSLIKEEKDGGNTRYFPKDFKSENKKLLEKEIALLKIFVNVPKAVNAIREIIKAWDIDEFEKPSKNSQTHHKSALNTDAKQGYSNPSGIKIFEYDISFYNVELCVDI